MTEEQKRMVKDLIANEEDLSDWRRDFLKNIARQSYELTAKQLSKLENMHKEKGTK